MAKFSDKAIQEAAYYIWQNAGCPAGNDDYFWAMAVEQLNGSNKSKTTTAASAATTKKSPAKKPVAKKKK